VLESPTLLVAIIALLGTSLTGVLGYVVSRRKGITDESADIRRELRVRVGELEAKIERQDVQLKECRDNYYKLLGEFSALKIAHEILTAELEDLRGRMTKQEGS
jgi:hypothetical protein